MAYMALENLLDKTEGSVYKLVVLASRRAMELAEGQPKLVDVADASLNHLLSPCRKLWRIDCWQRQRQRCHKIKHQGNIKKLFLA